MLPISPGYYGHSKRYKKTMVTKRAKFWGVSKVNYGQMRLILIFFMNFRLQTIRSEGKGAGWKESYLSYLSTVFWTSASSSYKWTLRAREEAASATRTVWKKIVKRNQDWQELYNSIINRSCVKLMFQFLHHDH